MRLLHKSVQTYLGYFLALILISIPLLYLLLNNVIVNETAEIAKLQFKPEMVDHSYLYKLKLSMTTENAVIRIILKTQLFVVVGLITGILLINRNLSRKIWKPFYATLNQLKQYQLNQGTELHLPDTGITEFDLLNRTIIQLTQKNQKVFAMQKEFTDNAAHEMQTPLAILHGQLELLIQQENLKEDQGEVLESMIEVCDRLSRLNTSLLLLAKIENEQFIQTDPLDMVLLADTMLRQFSEQFKDKGINYRILGDAHFVVLANKTLMEILLSNLISNAIKYNINDGSLLIFCGPDTLKLVNTGAALPLDNERMYERFSKNQGNPNSIGLGLAIVKRICEICAYQIDYKYLENSQAHQFEIQFNENQHVDRMVKAGTVTRPGL